MYVLYCDACQDTWEQCEDRMKGQANLATEKEFKMSTQVEKTGTT